MMGDDDEIYEPIEDGELMPSEDVESVVARSSATAEPASADASLAGGVAELADIHPDNVRYSQVQLRRARDLLSHLYAARRTARFYPLEHPAARESLAALGDTVAAYHSEGVDVNLAFYEGEILLGQQLLTEESVLFDQLVRDMTITGASSLVIRRGVTMDEYERLLGLLTSDARTIDQAGGIELVVKALDMRHIDVGSVMTVERVREQRGTGQESAKASYTGAISLIREVDRLMRANRHISSGKVKGVVRSLVDNVLTNRYAMLQLTGLRNYDEYTFYHSANVAILSLALGSAVTTDYRFLSSLGVGALLHDIGKLSVDLQILNKPGALTVDEWANVRQHPIAGAQMVSLMPGVDKSAIVTILEHHMRTDASGYPTRVPPRKQHLASRIVAVADSYDAMTSRRSYSAARVQDEAMAMLVRSSGNALDPALVRLFIRLMGVYPPRSVVRLNTGEVAIVVNPSEADPTKPLVRVIATAGGDFVDPTDVDLTTDGSRSVEACLDPRLLNIEVDDYI